MPARHALALALLAPALAPAHEPALRRVPDPVAAYLVSVEEGSPWGEHRLYLRLFPPGRGVPVRIPFMAGSGADGSYAAFEVPDSRHAPTPRPAGWAELGEIPEDGAYSLRVSAGAAGTRSFRLRLRAGELTLEAGEGGGNLEVGVPRAARLPSRAFTFRFDPPHGFYNRVAARRVWMGSLLATPGVRLLNRPESPLSDSEFEAWLDEGAPLLVARDARQVFRTFTEMALHSDAQVVVRWYGGLTWDLRDTRDGVCPEPCWIPNLDYVMPPHIE